MKRKMIKIGEYVYSVYENGDIFSEPKFINRASRWGTLASYRTKRKKLIHDIKEKDGHKLARVQLYSGEGYRYCYYVSKLVYALFNGLEYKSLKNIHYKDGNSLNSHIDNLYPTDDPFNS